jgi:hypothetical protein
MPPITFVTAFLNLGEDRSKDKSAETCFVHFARFAATGVSIRLYLSPCYKAQYERICTPAAPNILVEYLELSDLLTWKEIEGQNPHLPNNRTEHHDTHAFMTLMNAKAELLYRSTWLYDGTPMPEHTPWYSTHYAWIDFSIFHVFKRLDETSLYLQMLGNSHLNLEGRMLVPGCWDRGAMGHSLFDSVNWRFCGGFMLGDIQAVKELYVIYRREWATTVFRQGITWEVNMLAHFENQGFWSPIWFKADHNDSIVRIPVEYISVVASLTTIPSREASCRLAIDSLLPQVDRIYLSVADSYKRFGTGWTKPAYMEEEPYSSKVRIVRTDDYGPATKYVGALDVIPPYTWTFICDDDQEYHPRLIQRMKEHFCELAVYQNHYHSIRRKTSGGLVHGYVGLCVNTGVLGKLRSHPLPPSAYFVDDQWMSIFLFLNSIPVRPSGVEIYQDIFAVLDDWHEKIGADSLAGLNNRASQVAAIAEFFRVKFVEDGSLIRI